MSWIDAGRVCLRNPEWTADNLYPECEQLAHFQGKPQHRYLLGGPASKSSHIWTIGEVATASSTPRKASKGLLALAAAKDSSESGEEDVVAIETPSKGKKRAFVFDEEWTPKKKTKKCSA